MNFHHPGASIFVPDGTPAGAALARVTHLGIGAHPDDLEIMAFHGIAACFDRPDLWFGAVTCTNGGGSPRAGEYAAFTDGEMAALRRREQEEAAVVGGYGALVQLDYTSAEVKDAGTSRLKDDLATILGAARPDVLYTHNPADKHDTHVAVALAAVAAVRTVPGKNRPRLMYGCEVWRSLDWMADADKIALDVGARESLATALTAVYDSQVAGGKRYDLAAAGRRRANATYFESHGTDSAEGLWFAMDLTPLVRDDSLDVLEFVLAHIDRFRRDVADRIRKHAPKTR